VLPVLWSIRNLHTRTSQLAQ